MKGIGSLENLGIIASLWEVTTLMNKVDFFKKKRFYWLVQTLNNPWVKEESFSQKIKFCYITNEIKGPPYFIILKKSILLLYFSKTSTLKKFHNNNLACGVEVFLFLTLTIDSYLFLFIDHKLVWAQTTNGDILPLMRQINTTIFHRYWKN